MLPSIIGPEMHIKTISSVFSDVPNSYVSEMSNWMNL